jgi:histidyl-tRNA synthetase
MAEPLQADKRSTSPLAAVKGMNDILPAKVPRKDKLPDSALWEWFETTVRRVLARYGYHTS